MTEEWVGVRQDYLKKQRQFIWLGYLYFFPSRRSINTPNQPPRPWKIIIKGQSRPSAPRLMSFWVIKSFLFITFKLDFKFLSPWNSSVHLVRFQDFGRFIIWHPWPYAQDLRDAKSRLTFLTKFWRILFQLLCWKPKIMRCRIDEWVAHT